VGRAGKSHETVAWLIGMQIEFVETVLSEPAAKPRPRPTPIPDLFEDSTVPAMNNPEDDWMLPGA
jgi:hypothetical protein